jgi:hypothetical protein
MLTLLQVTPLLTSTDHMLILSALTQRFNDLYWWLSLVTALIGASFTFTVGAYLYTYMLSCRLSILTENHVKHLKETVGELKKKMEANGHA